MYDRVLAGAPLNSQTGVCTPLGSVVTGESALFNSNFQPLTP
uniref:Uncharacterized protein n=1 Tax=Anguilla anguilla TaxID=7936 RepID=A0A0E9SAP2_ANGAN